MQIFNETFINSSFFGHFENIYDLHFIEKAFFGGNKINITILKCNIELLPSLYAMKSIHFSQTNIDVIETGAFDVIKFGPIVFELCSIGKIKKQAISNRVS